MHNNTQTAVATSQLDCRIRLAGRQRQGAERKHSV